MKSELVDFEQFAKEKVKSIYLMGTVRMYIKFCNEHIKEIKQGCNNCNLTLDELKCFKYLLNKRLQELEANIKYRKKTYDNF